jgi:2-polyprenyl-3-methyl-5-hydroxy-6-metoxy-1,4-benzoquinol methylase
VLKSYQDKDLSYYAHTRRELVPYLPEKMDTVLDVGCATGNFGQMLKELRGSTVWGIEPDAKSAAEAAKKLDKAIHAPFDNQVDIPASQKFDCIFFNDVLEHLAEPEEALLLAASMLTDGGQIIASIPNIRFYPVMLSLLRYKDFRYAGAGVMDKTHLRFFTHKSMIRMFESCNLKIQKTEGINLHPDFKWFNLLNLLLFNTQTDMKYPQFVIVAGK